MMRMRWFARVMGAVVGLALLAGCCVNERCDCADENADTLWLQFDRDTTSTGGQGFRQAELDTVYLVRLALDTLDRPRRDSVLLVRGLTAQGYGLPISRHAPFPTNPRKASGYEYRIRLPHAAGGERIFHLHDIGLGGRYNAVSACCTCYENTRKEARLDNGPLRDLRDANGAPVWIDLRR